MPDEPVDLDDLPEVPGDGEEEPSPRRRPGEFGIPVRRTVGVQPEAEEVTPSRHWSGGCVTILVFCFLCCGFDKLLSGAPIWQFFILLLGAVIVVGGFVVATGVKATIKTSDKKNSEEE